MQKDTKNQCIGTSNPGQLDYFNLYLQLPTSELIWDIGGAVPLSSDEINYLINPRRLRGSDFLMRWAQGRWSEEMDVINQEGKRPDLLLYEKATYDWARNDAECRLGSVEKVAETSSSLLKDVISRATAALEVENSLWVTEKMPGFNKPFSRYQRGKNKGRLKPAGIVPTIIVKQEDIPRLQQWEDQFGM